MKMIFEVDAQLMQEIVNLLQEMPAKISFGTLKKIEGLVAQPAK